jgi:hypothetical protein
MQLRRTRLVLAVCLALFPVEGISAEQKGPPQTLKPGTMLKAGLESELSSSSASKNDRFSLKILFVMDEGKRVAIPRGTRVSGKISAARSARREEAGFLTLVVDQLVFPDGKTETIRGEIQFPTLKDITPEISGEELTLRGGVQESEKMTVHSSTENVSPPSTAEDVARSDVKYPDKRKRETIGGVDLTKKKGHDVEIAAGVLVNIRILEPRPPETAAPKTSKPPQ